MGGRLRSPGWAALLVAAGVFAGLLGGSCRRATKPDSGAELSLATVRVKSPAMALSARDLSMRQSEGRQQWSFTLVCDQRAGCQGPLRLVLKYRSRGVARRVEALREVDLSYGEEVRVGRSGPVEPVDRVEELEVTLQRRGGQAHPAASGGAGVPRPTPRG